MKIKKTMRRIRDVFGVIVLLLLCWTASYYLIFWLFQSRFPTSLSPYVWQIITSSLGFVFFGIIVNILTRWGPLRNQQTYFFKPMIAAIKHIAQGNYDIDLSSYKDIRGARMHPFQEIVESFKEMAKELGEMEEMRQEFISNVSHEIQSPLTSIRGFAHTLKNEQLSAEERQQYVEIIEVESWRLSKLSENLLKLTSLESEHPPFEPKAYRLDQQLRRIILSNEPQWRKKDLEIDVSLEPATIQADEALMDQVWINLLHNSIKFTPNNGKISIYLTNKGNNSVSVSVKDSGIGMTKDIQMHIFERFYKADRSRTRTAGGSGLGLSIVKKIIALHHADIQVISQPEHGTEFIVRMPIEQN